MAKASVVAARQANAVESIDSRLEKVEKQNNQILKLLKGGIADVTVIDGKGNAREVEGEIVEAESGWTLTDGELNGIFATVEQICTKAGVAWEAAALDNPDFDPVDYLQTHLTRIADRFAPPVVGVNPVIKGEPQPKMPEAGKVGTDTSAASTGDKPKSK